jgi:hypothetical protein
MKLSIVRRMTKSRDLQDCRESRQFQARRILEKSFPFACETTVSLCGCVFDFKPAFYILFHSMVRMCIAAALNPVWRKIW